MAVPYYSQIPLDQLIIQRLSRLEERVTRLEKERKEIRSHYMADFFDSINGSELFYVLSKRLEECGYSIPDIYTIHFSGDATGFVICHDDKRIDFTM